MNSRLALILVSLLLELHVAWGAESAALLRGPYLQGGTPTRVLVRWRTSLPTESVVQFGLSTNFNCAVTNDAPTTEHEVELEGLQPATRYYYAIGTAGQMLAGGPDYFFQTAPTVGTPKTTRVWILGDSGMGDESAASVRDAYYAFNGTRYTDLWIMLGDNAYYSGLDEEYQTAVFEMYPRTLRQSVLWSTMGNHEYYSLGVVETIPYLDIFTLPTQGEAGGLPSGSELYYSFDYANMHFICLDSMSTDRSTNSPMMTWMREDIAQTSQEWIIAFWHHPPYSKGSHDSDTEIELIEMRANALPDLEQYGVDLVLAGHSHSYERSKLINGHYGNSSTFTTNMVRNGGYGRLDYDGAYLKPAGGLGAGSGTVYIVCGVSSTLGFGRMNHPTTIVSRRRYGSLIMDVSGSRLDMTFLQSDGVAFDWFTMMKTNAPDSLRPKLQITRSGQEVVLSWPTGQPESVLEISTNPAVATWTTLTNQSARQARRNVVPVDLTQSNALFRLRRDAP